MEAEYKEMYRNIMFDLDGTLTDSGRAITSSVEYALAHFGYNSQPKEKLESFIGPSLYDSFAREYNLNDEECNKAVELYRAIYESGRMYDVDVYKGIPELLNDLKARGYEVFVITSKPLRFTEKILSHIGLDRFIDHQVGPDLADHSSDKKRLIERAINLYGLRKEECLMIGDTKYDILGASGAGVDSVGVTYGYGKEDDLQKAGATYIASDADAIERIINNE